MKRYREIIELLVMFALAGLVLAVSSSLGDSWRSLLLAMVVGFSLFKTGYFVFETLLHLQHAITADLPYHRFVMFLAYNMAEVTFSFALDYYLLTTIDRSSFDGIKQDLTGGLLLFECFYFSVLNFSYFGYGEIMPATIPAKIIVLTEIITAFSTVIFLLSDFISMKESIRRSRQDDITKQEVK